MEPDSPTRLRRIAERAAFRWSAHDHLLLNIALRFEYSRLDGHRIIRARPHLRMKMGAADERDRGRTGGATPRHNLIRPTLTHIGLEPQRPWNNLVFLSPTSASRHKISRWARQMVGCSTKYDSPI